MANFNTDPWQRFENGGKIFHGGSTNEIKNIVPGSFRHRRMQRERIINMDRGVIGSVTIGDQRPQEIEFDVWRTKSVNTLLAAMMPAPTNGVETFFSLVIKIPDDLSASTGQQWTLSNCFLPDGPEEIGSDAGQSCDKIHLRILVAGDIPTPVSY